MPDWDFIASGVKQPDPLEQAQGLQRYRILSNQASITGNEAQQKGIDTQALANYGQSGNPQDLRGASPDLGNTTQESISRDMDIKKDTISRDANYIANEQNPQIKQYLWNAKKADYVKRGWITQGQADKYPQPDDNVLNGMVRDNLSVPTYRDTTGLSTGAQAASRAPFDIHEINPNNPQAAPALLPGGPLGGGDARDNPTGSALPATPAGTPPRPAPPVRGTGPLNTNPINSGSLPAAPSGTGPAPPNSKNLTDTSATVLPPAPPGTPPGKTGTSIVAQDKTNPYASEVPDDPIGRPLPTGRGIVQQGTDPATIQARADGVKRMSEDLAPAAATASKVQANLGTIESELRSGKATTDSLADVKNTVAGLVYAVTKNPDEVKNLTGMNMADQEVVNKEATRMGMEYAKSTNGARQAVQALTIELGANPNMLNTVEGNLKVVKLLKASAQYDQETSKAAQAYFQKNQHLAGFDNWWTSAHPAAQFVSHAVPYTMPANIRDAQPGITYEVHLTDPTTKKPIIGADGKPVVKVGTWDGATLNPRQ